MADKALATVARLREEMIEAANKLLPGLDPVRAFAAGGLHASALKALAGVDAVLELHKPVDRGRVMACCEGCEAVNGEFHEDCCHEWPCPTYEVILAALTGKPAGNYCGFDCDACGLVKADGWPDPESALRALIAHLEGCKAPDADEYLEGARETLAELTGKAGRR